MPISERMLRKYRGEALRFRKHFQEHSNPIATDVGKMLTERILKLTQELLDQALLRREAEK